MKPVKRKIVFTTVIAFLLLAAGWVGWKLWFEPELVGCTGVKRLCAAGCALGRTGPKCEFALCPGETGTVTGKVSVGPLCPVEPCDANPLDFSSNQIILESQSGKKTTGDLSSDGSFSVANLAPGTYQITLKDCDWLGCASELPQTVTVRAGEITELTINIDTGIR